MKQRSVPQRISRAKARRASCIKFKHRDP